VPLADFNGRYSGRICLVRGSGKRVNAVAARTELERLVELAVIVPEQLVAPTFGHKF